MSTQTEFAFDQTSFEVDEKKIEDVFQKIEEIVRDLREKLRTDDRLEEILNSREGKEVLKTADSKERAQPEPLTQNVVIEKLLKELELNDFTPESSGYSDERGLQADYSMKIDSERLLFEAEPLNKDLERSNVGLSQVRDWLQIKQMESNFGIATNGLRWVFIRYNVDSYTYETLADINLTPVFKSKFEKLTGRTNTLEHYSDEDQLSDVSKEILDNFIRFFSFPNLKKIVLEAEEVIREKNKEITNEFYDEYIRLVFGILDEESREKTNRCLTGNGVRAPNQRKKEKRLFSVHLMNRLIFIKFLEDIGIVDSTLLRDLKKKHEDSDVPQSLYDTYIKPLFYDILNKKKEEREERIKNITLFSEINYLNGGLFRPTLPEEKKYEVSDSVLYSIIDFLEEYEFSTEGDPQALDPSILGNVFEKTMNYLAGVEGKQKNLGAYYTPDPITKFCAEKTVERVVFNKFVCCLKNSRDWPPQELQYDNVEELIEDIPNSRDLINELNEKLDEIKILDPACGSGHFLTSVLAEIVKIRKMLERKKEERSSGMEIKKRTVMDNIFGVDIVPPAVEITKLRLWLSIISELEEDIKEIEEEDLALPNIAFNIKQGNSLVGFSGLTLEKREGESSKLIEWNLSDKVPEYLAKIKEAKTEHDNLEELQEEIEKLRMDMKEDIDGDFIQLIDDLKFEESYRVNKDNINKKTIKMEKNIPKDCRINKLGFYIEKSSKSLKDFETYYDELTQSEFTPYTWKANYNISNTISENHISNFRDGLLSHPQPESITEIFVERSFSKRDLEDISAFQWVVEFPEALEIQNEESDTDFGFDVIIGNPPFGAEIEGKEKKIIERNDFFLCQKSGNSAEYFMERALKLCKDDGFVSFVLPKTLSYYENWKDIRNKILSETETIDLFDNGKAFEGVDYEQLTTVISPKKTEGNHDVNIYLAEDLRSTNRNSPELHGSVPYDLMKKYERLILRPMKDTDLSIINDLNQGTFKLEEVWEKKPFRGVYIPDDVKDDLSSGTVPFIEKVPSIKRFYLKGQEVWYIELDDLSNKLKEDSLETKEPRLLLKVLRGSELRVYKDGTGKFVSTGKLVNLILNGKANEYNHNLQTMFLFLNSKVVSYYLQKIVYSETTETARVMDSPYCRDIPIQAISEKEKRIISKIADITMFINQYHDDVNNEEGENNSQLLDLCDFFDSLSESVCFVSYFNQDDYEELWSKLEPINNSNLLEDGFYEEWADKRFNKDSEYPFQQSKKILEKVFELMKGIDKDGITNIIDKIYKNEKFERMLEVLNK